MSFDIRPLSDALGAEIIDLDAGRQPECSTHVLRLVSQIARGKLDQLHRPALGLLVVVAIEQFKTVIDRAD